jgi:hypothetical protein
MTPKTNEEQKYLLIDFACLLSGGDFKEVTNVRCIILPFQTHVGIIDADVVLLSHEVSRLGVSMSSRGIIVTITSVKIQIKSLSRVCMGLILGVLRVPNCM